MLCPICKDTPHTVTPIYDYSSGVMWNNDKPQKDTKFECSNGHKWEIDPEDE